MKKINRVLSVFLCVLMIASLCQVTTMAEIPEWITSEHNADIDLSDRLGGFLPVECLGVEETNDEDSNNDNTVKQYNSGETIFGIPVDRFREMEAYVYSEMQKHVEKISISVYNIPFEYHSDIGRYFAFNYPDVFALYISYSYSSTSNKVTAMRFNYVNEDYNKDKEDWKICEEKILEYKDLVADVDSEMEKYLYIHDKMIAESAYDYGTEGALKQDSPDPAYTAHGFFIEKACVCQGFAIAMRQILNTIGIENRLCASENLGHIWNLVKIDGVWYSTDVTWDNPYKVYTKTDPTVLYNTEYSPQHRQFLVTKEYMTERHALNGRDDSTDQSGIGEDLLECVNNQFMSGFFFNNYAYYYKPGENCSYIEEDFEGTETQDAGERVAILTTLTLNQKWTNLGIVTLDTDTGKFDVNIRMVKRDADRNFLGVVDSWKINREHNYKTQYLTASYTPEFITENVGSVLYIWNPVNASPYMEPKVLNKN